MISALLFTGCGKGGDSKDSFYGNLFDQGMLAVKTDGKWGYVNKKGECVIDPQFDYVVFLPITALPG